MNRNSKTWKRNYVWNLAALKEPGAIDRNYKGSVEELAATYADADTEEGIKR